MEWQRVTNTEHKGWPAMWYLYQHSFPLSEQRTIQCQIEAMQDPQYHCYGLWEHDVFIGILMYWAWDNQQYIEHFAINPQLRGQGYGSIILKKLMDNQHTIILEIDPPIDEISIKRLHFYEQLGFQMNPYQHLSLIHI